MKHLLIVAALAAVSLSACSSPYREALDSKVSVRPAPLYTAADQRALEPYNNSHHFRDR